MKLYFQDDAVTLCPICRNPMPAMWPNGLRAVYCSKPCCARGNAARIVRRNSSLDEMAVVRLVSGSPVTSTKAERREATRQLTARGRSASWIAESLHITERSVTRYRAELKTNRKAA